MKEIERLILMELLIKLDLHRARMEFNNKYVFGWDDARRAIEMEIEKLN